MHTDIYRNFVENRFLIVKTDPSGIIEFANDSFCKHSGFQPDDLIGRHFLELVYDSKELKPEIERNIESSALWSGEVRIQTQTNEHFWSEMNVIPEINMDNQLETIHIIHKDITQHKELELEWTNHSQKVLEDELLFKTLIRDINIGILLQGPNAEMLVSNQSALDLLGITLDQLMGRSSFSPEWNVIHEDGTDFPGPTHPVPMAIQTKQPVRDVVMGVYRPVLQDRVWLLVDAIPRLTKTGEIENVICTFFDITQIKNSQEEIEKSKEKLKDQNERLKEIAWIQSHEIRGPVSNIIGLLQLVEFSNSKAQVSLEVIEQLKSETNLLDKLIRKIVESTTKISESAQ